MAEVSKWDEIRRHMKRSLKQGWKLYSQSKYGIVGLALILIFAIMAIFAPFLTPYTPQFEAPTEDALRTYLYAFNTTDQIEGMVIGYTQLNTGSTEAGDWIILNHGNTISGIFVQNPKRVGKPNEVPWATKPLKFTIKLSDIKGLSPDETVKEMAFLSPSTSDLQYHYSGPGQDPDWDGELVFITQKHMVIYDIHNLMPNSNYNRMVVVKLNYNPSWIVVDTTSSGDTTLPVIYSQVPPPVVPSRFIAVGDAHHVDLYWYYYTYSNDSNMPSAQNCLYHIFNATYTENIMFRPLLFYNDALYNYDFTKDQNVFVVPLQDKTLVYRGFDIHSYPMSIITPGSLPITPMPQIVETQFNFSLTAPPSYYPGSPDYGKNYIFLPAVNNGVPVVYVMKPNGDANGHAALLNDWTINLQSGIVTAPPSVSYAGGNFTVYITTYVNDTHTGYLYRFKKGATDKTFYLYPFKHTTNGVVKLDSEVIRIDYVAENSEIFLLTKNMDLYLLDLNQYERAGYVSVGKFTYYNNQTGEISVFPYPPGSKLSYYTYLGTLSGSKYSATAASFDIYGVYYCKDTKTVGLVILKGENLLPLPPGRYYSGNWYILGTDDKGHDIWTWLVYGSRVAFTVGILAAFFSVMIGTLYGVYSGFRGGMVDTILMRFVDIMLTLPVLPILLILTSILGPSIWNIILVISVLGWAGIARVIRAQTLSLRARPFVDAARVAGASKARIMLSHIFPNVLPYSFLYMTLGVAGAILSEAALSFLGLGDPRAISWGQMLYSIQTAGAVMYAWWWLLPPGLAITLISTGFYLIGRAFDEILNPRLRKR